MVFSGGCWDVDRGVLGGPLPSHPSWSPYTPLSFKIESVTHIGHGLRNHSTNAMKKSFYFLGLEVRLEEQILIPRA